MERRRYFRIEDEVGLVIVPDRGNRRSGAFSHDATELAQEFGDLSDSMSRHSDIVRTRMPDLCAYLEGINTKMDMLVNWMSARELSRPSQPIHSVELSAIGIAFEHDRRLDVGAEVELRLLLFPERSCVRLSARVIRCNSRADGDAFYIALDFNEPDERERDRLAAHVMRRHSRILRGRNAAPR